MMPTPLVIGPPEIAALAGLTAKARANVYDIHEILRLTQTPDGKQLHMKRMTAQTIVLPVEFLVTFSVESGHPAGTCLHMSMSSPRKDRLPTTEAVWMVAEQLGFRGGIDQCTVWIEDLQRGHERTGAINIVQPIAS